MKKIAIILFFLLGSFAWLTTQNLSSYNLELDNIIYNTAWAQCDDDEKDFEVDCSDGGTRTRCTTGLTDCSPTTCPIASQ